jgi:hypothetical protein
LARIAGRVSTVGVESPYGLFLYCRQLGNYRGPAGLNRTQKPLGFSENFPAAKDFFLLFPGWMFLIYMRGIPAGFSPELGNPDPQL